MEFSIKSGDNYSHIVVDIIQYRYPNKTNFGDGNWVDARIMVVLPGYTADFSAYLRIDEINNFMKDMKTAYQDLQSIVRFQPREPWIEFIMEPNKPGQFIIKGKATNPLGIGAVLSFEFRNNQSYFMETIVQVDKIMKTFPVKGNP